MNEYSKYNAASVLAKLDAYIATGRSMPIRAVCDELSIFDWWTERLSVANAKKMRAFCKNAIELGYAGYVCFKVGASGCANGMWAHKAESTDGYSPDGDSLYRSFSPDYTYYNAEVDGVWVNDRYCLPYDAYKTIHMLKRALAA